MQESQAYNPICSRIGVQGSAESDEVLVRSSNRGTLGAAGDAAPPEDLGDGRGWVGVKM